MAAMKYAGLIAGEGESVLPSKAVVPSTVSFATACFGASPMNLEATSGPALIMGRPIYLYWESNISA